MWFEIGSFVGIAALLAWALSRGGEPEWFGFWLFFVVAAILVGWIG